MINQIGLKKGFQERLDIVAENISATQTKRQVDGILE